MAVNLASMGNRTVCLGQQLRSSPFTKVKATPPRSCRRTLVVRSVVQGDDKDQTRVEAPTPATPEDTADWDMEMSIFKQRTMRPNQLATLRDLQARVDVGKVVDDKAGPLTKRDYELFKVPVGAALVGQVVDHIGRPIGAEPVPLGNAKPMPILNKVVEMEQREQIKESLLTGVKALDVLTPLGRGQQMLVIGPHGSGKTTLAIDVILGQKGAGMRCVYAAVGGSQDAAAAAAQRLAAAGAMSYTTVVSAPGSASLSEQVAAIATACCLGERVREEGGASLVVVDSLAPLAQAWERLAFALAALGEQRLADGLFKDSNGREIAMPTPQTDDELVQYEGTMVTAAAAMRRGFFTSLLQRAAKMDVVRGSGSMTLVACVPGRCATGQSAQIDMSKYKTLSEEQKGRILKALQAKAGGATQVAELAPGELRTELVEEMMSISDGQVVMEPRASPDSPYMVSPQLSISRIGSRAYYKALEALAPTVRFELAQAADARKFSSDPNDPVLQQQEQYAARLRMALTQAPGQPASLAQQVVILYAIKSGFLASMELGSVSSAVADMLSHVEAAVPEALAEIASTKQFTAHAERLILQALQQYAQARS